MIQLGFRFLEHTADIYVEAHGKTLEEAFEEAALAMFESMTDTKNILPKTKEAITVKQKTYRSFSTNGWND